MEKLEEQVKENSKRIKHFEDISEKIVTVINGYTTQELKRGIEMIVEIGRIFYITKKFKMFWIALIAVMLMMFFGLDFDTVMKWWSNF